MTVVPPSPLRLAPLVALAALLPVLSSPAALSGQLEPDAFAPLEARSIGPAVMSGRVAAIEGEPGNAKVLYVGAATGGVWKSTDAGTTWEPVFDEQSTSSIGAIRVHPANPDLVWVGTGEGNMRNSSGLGRGVWKSLDGGRTWEHTGLDDTEHVHRIAVHPTDPDVAYVAAAGSLWRDGGSRGVYRTTDGGESWELVLEGENDRTGGRYVVVDPRNPLKLFATLWEMRRWPHFFESGGEGSGLHVSHDGGDSWREITEEDGLPEGPLGAIGVDIAPSDPDVVYAVVEARRSAFVRSDDGGRSWSIVNQERGVAERPFYYGDLMVDPGDADRVYSIHGTLDVSTDGGRTFEGAAVWDDGVHVDHHALWIDPEDPDVVVDGNDGGVYISRDRTGTWRLVENLPLAQYYEIAVDMEIPYNIYGGLQDNGSWRGPSEVWAAGGIRDYHWTEIGFGDGFGALADPEDPRYGYSMSQGGALRRYDLETGERRDIRPDPPADTVELRFNWNSPLATDPHDGATLYYGSQFVHRSTDRGLTWEVVSPDLTTDSAEWQRQHESGGLSLDVTDAENYTTIYALAPSPAERDVLWAGTDDGNVHVTRDGGETWTAVHDDMPDKPRHGWVSHIEASPFEGGTAFAVVHDYMRGDWAPYLYRTDDYGESWERLGDGDVEGPLRTVAQDPVNPDLLYLGSEFGLYLSLDGGGSWIRWSHGVPTVPVRALTVHDRDHDLVVGSHGRGAFVLDDVRPLRALAEDPGLLERAHLFEAGPVHQHRVAAPKVYRFDGDAQFSGENAPYGALLTYTVPAEAVEEGGASDGDADAATGSAGGPSSREEDPGGDGEAGDSAEVILEVLDADSIVRTDTLRAGAGLNRTAWDLRRDGFLRPADRTGDDPESVDRGSGPEVLPGTYTLRLVVGADTTARSVEVRSDPRTDVSAEERRAKLDALLEAGSRIEAATEAVRRIREVRGSVADALAILERSEADDDEIRSAAESLRSTLHELEEDLIGPHPDSIQGIAADSSAMSRLNSAYGSLSSSWDAPTAAQRTYLEIATSQLAETFERVNDAFADEVAAFRDRVEAAGLELVPRRQPLEIEGR